MNKRIFIISVLFFIGAVGIAGIYFWKNPSQIPGSKIVDTDSPFGTPAGNREPGTNPDETGSVANTTTILQIKTLSQISEEPVSGATFLPKSQTVRYTERATGHVLGVNLDTGEVLRVSNTTIPKIYESVWSAKGDATVMRSLDGSGNLITSYLASFSSATTSTSTGVTYKMSGTTLPTNIEQLAFSPNGKNVFYIQSSGFGVKGYRGGVPNNTKPTEVFSSPLSEWSVAWPEENTITFTTRPSAGVMGTFFKLNLKNNSFTRVLGSVNGLVAIMSPDATNVAFTNNTGALSVFNVKTASTTSLKLSTVADKCVWSKRYPYIMYCAVPEALGDGQIPNAWYLGSVSYADQIYQINIQTGEHDLIGAFKKTYGASLDIMNPVLNDSETTLTFINKKDLTLWSFQLGSGERPY